MNRRIDDLIAEARGMVKDRSTWGTNRAASMLAALADRLEADHPSCTTVRTGRACENCMWWIADDQPWKLRGSGMGECRGAPPAPSGLWPKMAPFQWCGSFRATETPEPAE